MANYGLNNNMAGSKTSMTTTFISLISVLCPASSMRRFKFYDILVGTTGTPADVSVEWQVIAQTSTTAGTSSAATPNPLDPADAASVSVGHVNYSAEPSVGAATTIMWYVGTNQRASYRWVAAPGSEIVWAATASVGAVLQAKTASGTTVPATATLYFQEQ